MANEALLKIINADGDLKRLTTADEDYIAYQAGLHLGEADSGEQASLTMSATNATSIGSFTDTFFNEPVGTHPGTSITSGSTATTVYQKTGIDIDSADNDFIKPVVHELDTGDIRAADNTKFYSIVDRAIKKIFISNYPGVFRLGSSSPGATYNLYKSNIFTDTRTDGTSVAYNLYRRSTSTPPTTVRPLYPISKDFKKYNDVQIRKTFGEAAKKRIIDTGIGTYQLRSSAEGAPTPGTWVAVGTATDTKNGTSEDDYTRISTRTSFIDYTRNSTSTFTRNSIRTSTRSSEVVYAGPYAGDYQATYNATYIGQYEHPLSPFIATYVGEYTRDSTRNDETIFQQGYLGDFIGDYTGIYTRDRTADSTRISTRTSVMPDDDFTRTSITAYQAQYGVYISNYETTYLGNYGIGVIFAQDSTVNYQINYGVYVADFIGNYEGGYVGPGLEFTRISGRVSTRNFSGYIGDYAQEFLGNYISGGYYLGGFLGDYTGNFIGDYLGISTRNSGSNSIADYTGDYTGNFIGDYTGNFDAEYSFYYQGDFIADYLNEYITDYIGNYTGQFEGNYDGDFTGDYIGDFAGNYVAGYEGNYTGNFIGTTIANSTNSIETYTLYVRTA